MLSLPIRNLVFTVVVPGLGGAWVPAWLLTRDGGPTGHGAVPVAWEAAPVIAAGVALYSSPATRSRRCAAASGPPTWGTGTRSRAGSRTGRPAKVSDEGVPYAGGGTTGAGKSRV